MTTDPNMTPTGDEKVAESAAPEAATASETQPEASAEAPAVAVSEPAPEAAAEPAPEPVAAPDPEPAPVAAAPAPTPAPAPTESPVSDADLFEQAMSALESGEEVRGSEGGYKQLSRGDRIEATVIQVEKDRVFVHLGTKSEGIVPIGELTEDNIEHAGDHVKVGDKIQVVVLKPEGNEGNPIVSKKRADFEEAWDKIEAEFQSGQFITAQVVDRVKGGLVVDLGVRGFVPATHVGTGKLRNIDKFVGQPMQLKIIEIDRDRKKVVLSNRDAEAVRRAEAKENLFKNVTPGAVLDGTVRRLTDYGAFVDLGGVDGLLHISEMSWMRINHPREMFKEGQKIKVMVLRLDSGAGKISLGHRQVLPDPWNLIKQNYTINQKFTCKVGRLVQAGAFVRLPEGAEAFLPLSEMSNRRLRKPEEAVEEGQDVEVQIIDLRPDERRMVLSMRAAGSADSGPRPMAEGGSDDDFDRRGGPGKKGKKKGGRGRDRDMDDFDDVGAGRRGFATGGATIGERLGMLKGFKIGDDDEDDLDEPVVEAAAESGDEEAQ